MKRIRACFALVLGLPLGAVGAQETPALAPGTRVRVTQPEGDLHRGEGWTFSVVGVLESIDSARIVVRDANGTLAVPRERGTRLYVSAGPGSCSGDRRGGCVAIGLFGGAAVGALAGFVYIKARGNGCVDQPCELIYLFTVPIGALVGTVVGAGVGGEQWNRVDHPVRFGLGPGGSGRLALGVSVQF